VRGQSKVREDSGLWECDIPHASLSSEEDIHLSGSAVNIKKCDDDKTYTCIVFESILFGENCPLALKLS